MVPELSSEYADNTLYGEQQLVKLKLALEQNIAR